MQRQMAQVREFYKALGLEDQMLDKPTADIRPEIKDVRQNLMFEEMAELFKAMNNKDLPEIFDALEDLQYVVLGTALAYGLENLMVEGFDEVHRSNMTKRGPDGVIVRKDGKVLKPPTFELPKLQEILDKAKEK